MSVKGSKLSAVVAPRAVEAGDRIKASDHEFMRRAVHALRESINETRLRNRGSWAESMPHRIKVIHADYLECVRIWRDGDGTQIVKVARPPRLRSETSRDGVTYTYTDAQTRTATKGSDTETQRVTTGYLVDDVIYVAVTRNKTGITEVDEQRGYPVDRNDDGRVWAAVQA